MASALHAKISNFGERRAKTIALRDAKTINAIKRMGFAKATARTAFLETSVTRNARAGARVVDVTSRAASAKMVVTLAGVVICVTKRAQKALVQKVVIV
jgi:hypothetical protein